MHRDDTQVREKEHEPNISRYVIVPDLVLYKAERLTTNNQPKAYEHKFPVNLIKLNRA